MEVLNKFKSIGVKSMSYGMLIICCVFAVATTYFLYKQTQAILDGRLKERLIAIVSTASLNFDTNSLNKISDEVNQDYEDVVFKLQELRNHNKNIKYAYLLRPTDDPNIFTYIADADSKDPAAEIDLNNDGQINDEDALVAPGEEYDATEVPDLVNEGTLFPTTDDDLTVDQWGTFLSAYAPIKENGKTIAVLGIDVDVSDYQRLISQTFIPFSVFISALLLLLVVLTIALVRVWAEQVDIVKELDRQKDELLSIVSHQLATPVASLKWYLEMLQDGDLGKLSKKQIEHTASMQKITINLADLVSMILDVSRIQLGRVKVDKSELDLGELFSEILDVIEPKAFEKNIVFKKDIVNNLPKAFLDKRYTRMTIENLLSNAIKYTPNNGRVDLVVKIKKGVMFCSVTDTGIGIPKAEQDKIFGKLFRASNARNSIEGNGFGLYVAKGAIEAQGGEIGFRSIEGKGTSFWIQLPLK